MQNWQIRYWEDGINEHSVEHWLDQLTKEQLKSVAKELKLLERGGNSLRLPHSKTLGEGLFELRERAYGFRIYYSFMAGFVIVLLHSGNKHTQEKDIKLARKRLEQLKSRN
jgi:putative addiction module killer protein